MSDIVDTIDALVDAQCWRARKTVETVAALVKSDVAERCSNTTRPLTTHLNRQGVAAMQHSQQQVPVPGLCECGCGGTTAIAKRNIPERGIRKGEHMRYIASHSGRSRTKLAPPDEVRFWKAVEKTSSCWLWTGPVCRRGYGRFRIGSRTTGVGTVPAHRYAYELEHGPVPAELHMDHLCRVHHCVRPNHLEPVRPAENIYRGFNPAAINRRKKYCPKGHEYTSENTRWRPRTARGTMYRCCAECERQRSRLRRAAKSKAA